MHHPHVVQPWTIVNKKWVLYGVGNTVAQQEPPGPTKARPGGSRSLASEMGDSPSAKPSTFRRWSPSTGLASRRGSITSQRAEDRQWILRPGCSTRNGVPLHRDAQAPGRIKAGIAIPLFPIQCSCIARPVGLRRRERTRFSSASDDEVGSLQRGAGAETIQCSGDHPNVGAVCPHAARGPGRRGGAEPSLAGPCRLHPPRRTGIYTWLPLGYRVLRKVEHIVREEMDAIGAQEVHFPALLPKEPYEATGAGPSTARASSG